MKRKIRLSKKEIEELGDLEHPENRTLEQKVKVVELLIRATKETDE